LNFGKLLFESNEEKIWLRHLLTDTADNRTVTAARLSVVRCDDTGKINTRTEV